MTGIPQNVPKINTNTLYVTVKINNNKFVAYIDELLNMIMNCSLYNLLLWNSITY